MTAPTVPSSMRSSTCCASSDCRTCAATPAHENLVVCGPSGTGKSHFLEALGHAAIDTGAHVLWFSLENLGALFQRRRADDTTTKAIRKIMRADLTCIDDIGLLPVTTETAAALYRVVDAAYERRAIALSSKLHPAGFDELMPKSIANATVDRLLHHAHIVTTTGDLIRLTKPPPEQGGEAPRPMTPGQTHRPSPGSPNGHRADALSDTVNRPGH